MVKVLVYAYTSGIFSSRKIAKRLHHEAASRVLGADTFSAHKAIRNFSTLHLGEFTVISAQVVRLAREMGPGKPDTMALDGNKIMSNVNRHKAMDYGRMQTI